MTRSDGRTFVLGMLAGGALLAAGMVLGGAGENGRAVVFDSVVARTIVAEQIAVVSSGKAGVAIHPERLVLANAAGVAAAELGTNDAGDGQLITYDARGRELITLRADVDGGGRLTVNNQGSPAVAIGVATEEALGVVITFDESGERTSQSP